MVATYILGPDELDAEGLPCDPVSLRHYPDDDPDAGSGVWIAECDKLPGYFGHGVTQAEAIEKLRDDFRVGPIVRLARIRFPDFAAQKRLYEIVRDAGGSAASSEALRPNAGKQLGASPSDLWKLRERVREAEEMLGCKIRLNDKDIKMKASLASGEIGGSIIDRKLARYYRAREKIAEHLRKTKNSTHTG